jgi:hypothetical protein
MAAPDVDGSWVSVMLYIPPCSMPGSVAFVLVLFYKIRRDFARFFGREQPARRRSQWKSGAARVEAGFSLVWRFRRAHHCRGKSEMRTSEPKPH